MAFHYFIFLPPLHMWFFTFYRYFLKRETQFNQRVVVKVLNSAPFFIILLNLTFPSASFLVGLWRAVLKRGLFYYLLSKNSAGKGVLLGYGMRW